MSYSVKVAAISLACIFGGAMLGRALRLVLPEHHLSGKSEDSLKVAAGMIATMAALVLGLLVGAAKSTLDSANTAIVQSAAKISCGRHAFIEYCEFRQFRLVASDENRHRHDRFSIAHLHSALPPNRENRAKVMLIRPHPTRDAVEDDADDFGFEVVK